MCVCVYVCVCVLLCNVSIVVDVYLSSNQVGKIKRNSKKRWKIKIKISLSELTKTRLSRKMIKDKWLIEWWSLLWSLIKCVIVTPGSYVESNCMDVTFSELCFLVMQCILPVGRYNCLPMFWRFVVVDEVTVSQLTTRYTNVTWVPEWLRR